MNPEPLNKRFANLAWLINDHVLIRINSSRDALDSMDFFTSMKRKSGLLQKEETIVIWVNYECDFLDDARKKLNPRFQILEIDVDDEKQSRSQMRVLSIVGDPMVDIYHTHLDTDGFKKSEKRLYLIHFVHMARLQGMLLGQCQFFTDHDANPLQKIAKRLGGAVNKHMLAMHNATEVLKSLV